jgi:hypothetical protein
MKLFNYKKCIKEIKDFGFFLSLAFSRSFDNKLLGFKTAWEVKNILRR